MFFSKLSVSLFAIGASWTYALPSPSRSTYAVKERHVVPRDWTEVGAPSGLEPIHLQIGLKQQNEGAVESHLLEISDPGHSRYGKHLSAEEIHKIVAPAEDTVNLVHAWLEEHDIKTAVYSPAKDWVSIVVPIEKAEELLKTSYRSFQHSDGSTISRAPEWSLPLHLHEHIDVVQPTTSFFHPRPNAYTPVLDDTSAVTSWWESEGKAKYDALDQDLRAPINAICNISFTTPRCLRTLYGTINYTPQAADQNKMGLCNYLNETNNRADTFQFLQQFRPAAAQAARQFEIVEIANAPNPQGPYTPAQISAGSNIEGNLDVQQMLSIGWPTPLTAFSTGGSPPFIPDLTTPTDTNEPYLVFLNYALAQSDLPQVISTSYGDDEQTVPESYARRVCSGFAQLGARGISVLFSSGDFGVGLPHKCFSNTNPDQREFLATFPAACPWVTTVGGTKGFSPEVAVSRFASGGGFSNYFAAPAYQKSFTSDYVASLNGKFDGLYNKAGRGYPDVAAQGNHDVIVWAGNVTTVGGTSASSPTFAAIIALVNDALLAQGKPTLGFLNPWIYSGAYKALTDVKSGSAFGCGTEGFPAQAGWDAVTGFGTPNFRQLVDAAFAQSGATFNGAGFDE